MTLLWYDLETFGFHSRYDRIAQFAAIRTDENLKQLEDPVVYYGKLSPDYLPDPMSCLLTGITPQEANTRGIIEVELIQAIDRQFSRPGTCILGYNSIAFDDEFIRNLYYRNFYDPYRREWANGNSRWDILNLARATRDLRPEGIIWPVNEEGRPSVKLDLLAEANNLHHEYAHDALSDVKATIAVANLIKMKQPKLFKWAWQHRTRNQARTLIDLEDRTPLIHTSEVHYSRKGYTTLVCPLVTDPELRNTIYAFDLRSDPEPLLTLPDNEIRHRIFTPTQELEAEGISRIPLKGIHMNKAPFLAPRSVLDHNMANRLGIDPILAEERWKRIKGDPHIAGKLRKVFSRGQDWGSIDDPDFQIYDRFFPDEDKEVLAEIRQTVPEKLMQLNPGARDSRIPEMLRRYIGRNYPDHQDDETSRRWKSFCASRILFPPVPGVSDLGEYRKRIMAWMENDNLEAEKKPILKSLQEYGDMLEQELLGLDTELS